MSLVTSVASGDHVRGLGVVLEDEETEDHANRTVHFQLFGTFPLRRQNVFRQGGAFWTRVSVYVVPLLGLSTLRRLLCEFVSIVVPSQASLSSRWLFVDSHYVASESLQPQPSFHVPRSDAAAQ